MSAPKKDWIFTAVLVVLIAVLSAVIAIKILPSGHGPGAGHSASPAQAEQTTPQGAGETLYSPPGAPGAAAGTAETNYSPAARMAQAETTYSTPGRTGRGAAANLPGGRASRGASARTETNYSPAGRMPRVPGGGRAVPASGAGATAVAEGEDNLFPNLGQVNPFDPIVTPTPTPTPLPPPTPQPINLERAMASWVLEYPQKHNTEWVFSDKTNKDKTYTAVIGQTVHLKDVREFDADVKPNGKWGVQFEYQGQVKKYSMME